MFNIEVDACLLRIHANLDGIVYRPSKRIVRAGSIEI
jgi:hypothetical protein